METSIQPNICEEREYWLCPLCGKDDAHIKWISEDHRFKLGKNFHIVQCQHCKMAYLQDRPRESSIGNYYPSDYITTQLRIDYSKTSLRDWLFHQSVIQREKDRIEYLSKFISLNSSSRVLDNGCGSGQFISFLDKCFQCVAEGIEIGDHPIKHTSNNDICIYTSPLRKLSLEKDSYDLITMWHYLEHDYRPLETLRICRDLLTENGFIVIEVPNVNSLECKIFGSYWSGLDVPRHMNLFSPETLSKIISEADLEVVSLDQMLIPFGWSESIQHLLGFNIYRNIKQNIYLAVIIYFCLMPLAMVSWLLKRSDWIRVVCRKRKLIRS